MSKMGQWVFEREELKCAVELSPISHDDFVTRCEEVNPNKGMHWFNSPSLDWAWAVLKEMKDEHDQSNDRART